MRRGLCGAAARGWPAAMPMRDRWLRRTRVRSRQRTRLFRSRRRELRTPWPRERSHATSDRSRSGRRRRQAHNPARVRTRAPRSSGCASAGRPYALRRRTGPRGAPAMRPRRCPSEPARATHRDTVASRRAARCECRASRQNAVPPGRTVRAFARWPLRAAAPRPRRKKVKRPARVRRPQARTEHAALG